MRAKEKRTHSQLIDKKKVFIVDDHPLYREGLAQFINKEPDLEVCGEAAGAVDALQLIKQRDPELVIVDVSLGNSSGIDLVKMIKAYDENLFVLVLSMHADALYAERALAAGARGYINKSVATQNIMEAIRDILQGKIYVGEEITQAMLEKKAHGISETKTSIDLLSDRELEVFELVGNGQTTDRIAKNLHLSTKTVETYRANIKNKLALANNTELIQRAVQWIQSRHK